MTNDQEEHLEAIQDEFCDLVDYKYRAGQKEHGGSLYDMDELELLDNSIDETVDLITYLLTLKQKLQENS